MSAFSAWHAGYGVAYRSWEGHVGLLGAVLHAERGRSATCRIPNNPHMGVKALLDR